MRYGSPTLCFCSGIIGRRAQIVPLPSGCPWHPERHRVLQARVSVKCHLSRISLLTLGHSLWCLSRALRHGASLLRLRRPAGYGFQKIFVQRTQKDFPNLP
jgi:hypothetical protein